MHLFLEEIKKIITCTGVKKTSKKECEKCLDNICESIGDSHYDLLYEDYEEHKDAYISIFSEVIGNISKKCGGDYCESCLIKKWCNHYRAVEQKKEENGAGYTYADFFCGAGG